MFVSINAQLQNKPRRKCSKSIVEEPMLRNNLKRAALGCLAAGILTGAFTGPAAAQNAFPAASPGEWSKVVAAARTEGKVIVYGGPTAQTGAQYKAAFEKQYPGMTLEYTRLFGQQLMVKLEHD
ncbi:MAG: hypothetical protein FJY55_09005, partial [Betaproteobacteria bacterium]|nr:hypothetical protein [Betaproteobacteria bacterium]